MSVEARGAERFRRYVATHTRAFGTAPQGRFLDFGCGAGGVLRAAVTAGLDARGVEVDSGRQEQFLRETRGLPEDLRARFTLYDGRLLPFASESFDACYSWFVFEHVTDPNLSLREIARVLRPGGTLTLSAEDARNAWDGHCKLPWPPYLPRDFAAAYLEGAGAAEHAEFVSGFVVYVSGAMVCDLLETLGFEIVYRNETLRADPELVQRGLRVASQAEAHALGAWVAARGPMPSPPENLEVLARKRSP